MNRQPLGAQRSHHATERVHYCVHAEYLREKEFQKRTLLPRRSELKQNIQGQSAIEIATPVQIGSSPRQSTSEIQIPVHNNVMMNEYFSLMCDLGLAIGPPLQVKIWYTNQKSIYMLI